MNCKACNKPIEEDSVAKFCSTDCAEDFNRTLSKVRNDVVKTNRNAPQHFFGFSVVLNKRGKFFISQKSLDEIYDSVKKKSEFELLLASNNLMVVRLDSELSVIKKNIL